MDLSVQITIGEKASGGPAGLIKGYKDPSSSVGGFGAISNNQYKGSKIFALEARKEINPADPLKQENKIVELIITPALSDKKLYIEMNGQTMTLDQYQVNKEVYVNLNDDFYDMIQAITVGDKIDIAIDDNPIIVAPAPKAPIYPKLKGNILIGQQKNGSAQKNSSYCSLYSSNKKPEQLELDVSNIMNNTLVKKGSIMMFHGPKAPKGWIICDGKNNTPKLIDMFIEATYKPGDHTKTGGTNTVADIKHTHTIKFTGVDNHTHTGNPGNVTTSKENGHKHKHEFEYQNKKVGTNPGCAANNGLANYRDWKAFASGGGGDEKTSSSGAHTHSLNPGSFNSNTTGNHKHTITVSDWGSDPKLKLYLNMPAYYSLVYIQKI